MSKPDQPRKALGRGMGALLPTRSTPPPAAAPQAHAETKEFSLELPIGDIHPNPVQPRRVFQGSRLDELAQSIRANGIIQPLVVRKVDGKYFLVAGERRWRAAKLAGCDKVPVVVRDIPEGRLLEVTLIENIQREDLNPMETANAYARMSADLHLPPDVIATRTGKDRSTIINTMRLLQLPEDIQQHVSDGAISAGHGRCLLTLPTPLVQREVCQKTISHGWSVRMLEQVCAKITAGKTPKEVEEERADPNVKAAIQEMERKLGTRVRIKETPGGKGRIEIDYYTSDDLNRLYEMIVGE